MGTIVLKADDPRLGKLAADGERQWPAQDINGQVGYDKGFCDRQYWKQGEVTYFVVVHPRNVIEDARYSVEVIPADVPQVSEIVLDEPTVEATPVKKGK